MKIFNEQTINRVHSNGFWLSIKTSPPTFSNCRFWKFIKIVNIVGDGNHLFRTVDEMEEVLVFVIGGVISRSRLKL